MIKKIIEEAIESLDGKLVRWIFGVNWDGEKWKFEILSLRECCPLGAVLLKYQPRPKGGRINNRHELAATCLGVNVEYTIEFARGFDGMSMMHPSEAYLLGREFGKNLSLKV